MDLNKLYLMDCMDGMKQFPDKYFDLAIVDPPYGGGSQNVHVERERETGLRCGQADFESRKRSRFGGRFDLYFNENEPRNGREVCPVRGDEPDRGYL